VFSLHTGPGRNAGAFLLSALLSLHGSSTAGFPSPDGSIALLEPVAEKPRSAETDGNQPENVCTVTSLSQMGRTIRSPKLLFVSTLQSPA
jgi:hypothetical protein